MKAIPLNKLPKGSKMKGTVAKKPKKGAKNTSGTFRRDGGNDMNAAPNIEMIAKFAAEKERVQRDARAKRAEQQRQQAILAVESSDPLYDEDEVTSPDFMGRISIEISEFCSTQSARREWFTLLPEEGKSDNVKGAVELIAQWWYNPALDFEPFLEPDDHADAPPNELRVAIVAARDLAIKDKNLLSRTGVSVMCYRV